MYRILWLFVILPFVFGEFPPKHVYFSTIDSENPEKNLTMPYFLHHCGQNAEKIHAANDLEALIVTNYREIDNMVFKLGDLKSRSTQELNYGCYYKKAEYVYVMILFRPNFMVHLQFVPTESGIGEPYGYNVSQCNASINTRLFDLQHNVDQIPGNPTDVYRKELSAFACSSSKLYENNKPWTNEETFTFVRRFVIVPQKINVDRISYVIYQRRRESCFSINFKGELSVMIFGEKPNVKLYENEAGEVDKVHLEL